LARVSCNRASEARGGGHPGREAPGQCMRRLRSSNCSFGCRSRGALASGGPRLRLMATG
jgi:hypothetical protein